MSPEQEALAKTLSMWPKVSPNKAAKLTLDGATWMSGPDFDHMREVITPTGEALLAAVKERDMYRLKAEWQEARAEALRAEAQLGAAVRIGAREAVEIALKWCGECLAKESAARAAYVAAGGVV